MKIISILILSVLCTGVVQSAETRKEIFNFKVTAEKIRCGESFGCSIGSRDPECRGSGGPWRIPRVGISIDTFDLMKVIPLMDIHARSVHNQWDDGTRCVDFEEILQSTVPLDGVGTQLIKTSYYKRLDGECFANHEGELELVIGPLKFRSMVSIYPQRVEIEKCDN